VIRPIHHRGTGLRFDISQEQPGSVIDFLAGLRDNLPHHEHDLICETAAGDQRVFVVRKPGGGHTIRHYPGHRHGPHHVIPESDEHKRGKDYASAELDRFGLPAGQEVPTDNRTRHDVATLEAPRIIAAEIQVFNRLDDSDYRRRTTLAMRATAFKGEHARPLPDGVLPVWVHAFGIPDGWKYPVPSIAAQDTRWDATPKPGSVTAIGPRLIKAEPCKRGSRWPVCPLTGRGNCGGSHPVDDPWPKLFVGEVLAMTAAAELVPIRYHTGAVYLVSPAQAALYEELGGTGLYTVGAVAERPASYKLGRHRSWRHVNAPAAPESQPEPTAPAIAGPCEYPRCRQPGAQHRNGVWCEPHARKMEIGP
jgi:hypothetical protein